MLPVFYAANFRQTSRVYRNICCIQLFAHSTRGLTGTAGDFARLGERHADSIMIMNKFSKSHNGLEAICSNGSQGSMIHHCLRV